MWIMAFLFPLACFITYCFWVLPPSHRKVPLLIGWLFVIPSLVILSTLAFDMSSMTKFMMLVTGLACYYVIRAAAFLGLDASFRAFAKDHKLKTSAPGTLMARILSIAEPVIILLIFTLAYFIDFPAKMNVRGMQEIMLVVTSILACGIGLSFMFLMLMHENRKRVAKLDQKDLKKNTPVVPLDRNKQMPPGKALWKQTSGEKPPWKQ